MKNLSMIASVSQDLGLGNKGELLWQIPEDMQFFRQTTMGKPVVMGSRTFDSIGKILPGRENIVLGYHPESAAQAGATVFQDKEQLDRYLEDLPGEKFIIGGGTLYKLYLDEAEKIYLTEIASQKPADTFFPEFDHEKYIRTVLGSGEHDGVKFEMVMYAKKTA